jgi:DNA-binding NarL/FixJ family response regulator
MIKIRVLIADDHKILREGLKLILEKNPEINIAGEACNGTQATQMAREIHPDIIIMDINMPDLNGIEATRRITDEIPGTRVLALSMNSDRGSLIRMLKAGAKGYLLKDCASDELLDAISVIMKNKVYISPMLVDDMVRDYVQLSKSVDLSAFSILTPRERDVLQKLAEGRSAKEIAFDLNLSVKTIETHKLKIQEKLGVHSLADLTKYAIREGLTSL